MKRLITVHIAGQRYLVRSDADEAYVQSLASTVDRCVNGLKGSRQVATQADLVLTAMQLADELHHERERQQDFRKRVRERAQRVLECLLRLSPDAAP